jgi:hypothetical protein
MPTITLEDQARRDKNLADQAAIDQRVRNFKAFVDDPKNKRIYYPGEPAVVDNFGLAPVDVLKVKGDSYGFNVNGEEKVLVRYKRTGNEAWVFSGWVIPKKQLRKGTYDTRIDNIFKWAPHGARVQVSEGG